MEEKYLYKLVNDTLISTETTKIILDINNLPTTVAKTEEELEGWKPLIKATSVKVSIYQNAVIWYTDRINHIDENIKIEDKPEEEIIQINKEFWDAQYYKFPLSADEIYYAPKRTMMNGEWYNLLQDDLPIMLMGAMSTQVVIGGIMADPTLTDVEKQIKIQEYMSLPSTFSYMEMYTEPDYTKKIDDTYLKELQVLITDTTKMTILLGTMATMLYQERTLPTVE